MECRHPNLFATLARDDDPARRLAFEIMSEEPDGSLHTWFAQSDKFADLKRANTAVEFMTLGLGREQFANESKICARSSATK